MNRIAAVILVLILCLSTLSTYAVQPPLKTDTLGAVYLNAARLQKLLSQQVTELADPANADKLAEIEKELKKHTRIRKLPFAQFIHGLKEMYEKKLLQPQGPLWFAIDSSYMPEMIMPATIKPAEFYAFLQEKMRRLKSVEPAEKSEDALSFNFSSPRFRLDFDLEKKGMFLSSKYASGAKADVKLWKDILETASEPDCLMAVELNINEIKKLPIMDRSRGFSEIIEGFSGTKFVINGDNAMLSLRVPDKDTRENINAVINQQKLTVKTVFENQVSQISEQDKQRGLKMIDSINSHIDGEWIKIRVGGFVPESAMWGVVGLVAGSGHLALPKLKKARNLARTKTCAANRRVLYGSTEMRLNEKPEGAAVISPEELVEGKYISELPQCPAGGKYSISLEDGQVKVECSIHGSD